MPRSKEAYFEFHATNYLHCSQTHSHKHVNDNTKCAMCPRYLFKAKKKKRVEFSIYRIQNWNVYLFYL